MKTVASVLFNNPSESSCVCVSIDLVWWLDVCKSLEKVGALYFSQRWVERVLGVAGDNQTHQAGMSDYLVHNILQTCPYQTTEKLTSRPRHTVCDHISRQSV